MHSKLITKLQRLVGFDSIVNSELIIVPGLYCWHVGGDKSNLGLIETTDV
jgi:hypothetical protein